MTPVSQLSDAALWDLWAAKVQGWEKDGWGWWDKEGDFMALNTKNFTFSQEGRERCITLLAAKGITEVES